MYEKLISLETNKAPGNYSGQRTFVQIDNSVATIALENVEPNSITPKSVIVKIITASVCGADIKALLAGGGSIFGHEIVGEIVFAGSDITQLKTSQKVILIPDFTNNRTTGFADYMLVHSNAEKALVVIPSELDPELAVFAEPLSCVVNSVERLTSNLCSNNLKGKHLAIIGGGNAGIMHAWLLKKAGAEVTIFNRTNEARHNFLSQKLMLKVAGIEQASEKQSGQFDIAVITTSQALPGIVRLGRDLLKPGSGYLHIYGGTTKDSNLDGVNLNDRRNSQDAQQTTGEHAILVGGSKGFGHEQASTAINLLITDEEIQHNFKLLTTQRIGLADLPDSLQAIKNGQIFGKIMIVNYP